MIVVVFYLLGDLSIWSTYSDSDLQPSKEEEIGASKDRIGLNLNFNLPSAERPGVLPLHYTNPERLYDGRMTHSKLQQVGRVTRDAIEALHRLALSVIFKGPHSHFSRGCESLWYQDLVH